MHQTKSEQQLRSNIFYEIDDKMYDNKFSYRKSLDGRPSDDIRLDEESLKYVIQIQNNLIDIYKKKLEVSNKNLENCKNKITCLQETNDFDVDLATNALIHHENDKASFKNALLFMQNRVKLILDSLEEEETENNK